MYPQALSRVLAIQPVLGAPQRDQTSPRGSYAFEHLLIGQKLAGQVMSQEKGISLVAIAGQTVAMRLPPSVVPGDTLKLSFAGHMPQPVFLLEQPGAGESDTPQLSQTARMLSEIMQHVPGRAPPTLTPPAPLLERPMTHPAELALALRNTLVRSGLFYESHLASWVAGQDTLDGLLQEPQNRLSTAARSAPVAGAHPAHGTATPAATSALAAGAAPFPPDAEVLAALWSATVDTPEAEARVESAAPGATDTDAPAKAMAGGAAETATPRPANPLHTLLTQQLQVLESPQFAWKGELWPGQPLEWQLRRVDDEAPAKGEGEHPAAGSGGRSWESQIRVTLPQLGALTLHIRLDAQHAFNIRVEPEQPAIGPLLLRHQPDLIARLTEAGCNLHSLRVAHEPAGA